MIQSVEQFWFEHQAWSQATFGTDAARGPLGALKHLEKEAREAQVEVQCGTKEDLHEEIADCLFLTFDAARRSGMTLVDLMEQCFAKLAKNRLRVWGPPTNSDEPIEHVRGIHD
jgi:phosphoribosyl-ATP pyrophosphohydrolase